MSRPRLALIITGLALIFPLATFAKQTTVWDFRGTIPGSWQVQHLTTADQTPNGLHIRTATEGVMFRQTDVTHKIDALTLTVASPTTIEAFFLWRPEGMGKDDIWQMPFTIQKNLMPTELGIDPTFYPEWNPESEILGFRFPAGSELLLQEIRLEHWNVYEKLWEGWKSVWTFDEFRPYSINFLWGPLVAFNGVARTQLFHFLPPRAWSALRLFYAAAFILTVACMGIWWGVKDRDEGGKKALRVGFVGLAILWLLLDLRMGLEVLSYAKTDWQTYVLQSGNDRTLRTHGTFYADMQKVLPALEKVEKYAIVTPPQSPYYSNMRYMTYPSTPLLWPEAGSGAAVWLIVERTDMAVDSEGRLFQHTGFVRFNDEGEIVESEHRVLTRPGRILEQVRGDTFLFEETR